MRTVPFSFLESNQVFRASSSSGLRAGGGGGGKSSFSEGASTTDALFSRDYKNDERSEE